MFIREAIAQGNADLKFAGIRQPGLDSSLLLAHVLKTDRTSLVARSNETLTEKQCASFCGLIERRAAGECVAYITEKKEFRGLEFFVNKSVLVPRPDTETLVEAVLEIINEESGTGNDLKVLDLCTGSGAAAIALKNELPELEVHAADISAEALEAANKNAEKLLGSKKISFYQGDLYDALNSQSKISNSSFLIPNFSIIISNPPYIPTDMIQTLPAEVQNEPLLALDGGSSGLEIIRRIIDDAPEYLQKGGHLLLEADPRQMDDIANLLDKKGYSSIKLYKDLSGSNRVIGGRL